MSVRGMLIALAVVLAAVAVFWLTGDRSPVSEPATRPAAERSRAGAPTAPKDQAPDAKGADGKPAPEPGWRRAMRRGSSPSPGAEAPEESPSKKAAREMKSTPHAREGAPQR